MATPSIIEVQQGIWIDAALLEEAGLSEQYRIVVEPGSIRILPLTKPTVRETALAPAWETFRQMGTGAQSGTLSNTAAQHDKYLYGGDANIAGDEPA